MRRLYGWIMVRSKREMSRKMKEKDVLKKRKIKQDKPKRDDPW